MNDHCVMLLKLKPQLNRKTQGTGEPRTMAYFPKKDGGVEWCQPKSNREAVWTAGDRAGGVGSLELI